GLPGVAKAALDFLAHFTKENFFGNISGRRRRREKWQPDLLNSFRERAARLSALFSHARSAFTIDRVKIGRECRRDLSVRAIRDGQLLEQDGESEVLLFEKRDMFFQEHAEVMARPLRQGLISITLQRLFG